MKKSYVKMMVGVLFMVSILLVVSGANAEPIKWKMVTNWPASINLWKGDQNFCDLVNKLSAGKLEIQFYKGGDLVPSIGVFDAVSKGRVEAGAQWASYWAGKNSAFEFGGSFPMGLTAQDHINWYYYGGGKEEYDYLFGKFNMVHFAHMTTGVESGIRSNVPLKSLADLKGKKLRVAGKAAGYMLQKVGAAQTMVASGEIYQALQLKTLDGAEFCTPAVDWDLGFAEVTKHNLAPGWHQPSTIFGVVINKEAWDALTPELQNIIEVASKANMAQMTAYYEKLNIQALKNFEKAGTTVYRYSEKDLEMLEKYAWEWVEQEAAKNPDYKRMAQSYFQFMKDYAQTRTYTIPWGQGRNPVTYPNIGLK